MPTLEWIGKKAVLNHHNEIPFRLLKSVPELSVGDSGSGNLLVQGDNLEALKALLPYYAGKVKCIYIDPPYNTGNENWKYNDAVNSPEMKKWLGVTVGNEGEDLSRHDKWLCMMYPRINLLKELLDENGAIFINIDDTELSNLKCMMDELFGLTNFLFAIIWQHSLQPKGYSGKMSIHHNYILGYRKSDKFTLRDLARQDHHNVNYSNPDNDPNGPWRSGDVRNALYRPNLIYDLVTPSGKTIKPPPKGWRWSKETMKEKIKSGEIVFRKDETKILRKIYLNGQTGRSPESIWFGEDVGTTREANQELKSLFDSSVPFETPKPTRLLQRIFELSTEKESLILDSFAGSGTTGHAILKMNYQDGGSRRFILVELEKGICQSVTYERLKRVINGTKNSEPIIAGFRYCELGPTLFDSDGKIRQEVSFQELANHVFFTETGEPLPDGESNSPLIGISNDSAVYLLYNGILRDKSPGGGNVLTNKTLNILPPHSGRRIIYGTACRLSPRRLNTENITFRQIPYQVNVR
jgi:adenine specific DNA methylase Mod